MNRLRLVQKWAQSSLRADAIENRDTSRPMGTMQLMRKERKA